MIWENGETYGINIFFGNDESNPLLLLEMHIGLTIFLHTSIQVTHDKDNALANHLRLAQPINVLVWFITFIIIVGVIYVS